MKDSTPYDPRTLEGLRTGFGWCRKCGGTWNWKRPFEIPTGPGRGCFPLCFDCGQGMSVGEIMVHLKAVRDSREPYPLPDGKIHEPEYEDLEYAERWLLVWAKERKAGEDPYDVKGRTGEARKRGVGDSVGA